MLDSGITLNHPAFAAQLAEGRIIVRNVTDGEAHDVTDVHPSLHGTHCAGTIAGGTVNGQRIGVAPGIDRLIIAKVAAS